MNAAISNSWSFLKLSFLDQKEMSRGKKDVASNKRSQVKRNVPLWVTGGNAVLCKSYAREKGQRFEIQEL